MKQDLKKRLFIAIMVAIAASIVLGAVIVEMKTSYKVYGEKLEEGVRVAYGTITNMGTVHGGDWYMKLNTSQYTFEFPYGTFTCDNRLGVGENIAIAYEWRLLFTEDCYPSNGDYHPRYYWAPLVLDWKTKQCSP